MSKFEGVAKLKDFVPKLPDYVWLLIGLVVSLFFQWLFWPITREMERRGYSIVEFELAWKKATMDQILSAWDGILDDAIRMTLLDFGFILGYTIVILSLLSMVNRFRKTGSGVRYYEALQILAIVAAIADVIENLFSIYILSYPHSYIGISVPLMSLVSTIKWAIIAIIILALLEGLVRGIAEKIRKFQR